MHTLIVITSRKFVPVRLSFSRLKQNLGGHRFEDGVEVETIKRADKAGQQGLLSAGNRKAR